MTNEMKQWAAMPTAPADLETLHKAAVILSELEPHSVATPQEALLCADIAGLKKLIVAKLAASILDEGTKQ